MWQRSLVTVPYIVITRHYARAIDEQKSVIPATTEEEEEREREKTRDKKENRANTMYHRLVRDATTARVLCMVILSRGYTRSTMKTQGRSTFQASQEPSVPGAPSRFYISSLLLFSSRRIK